MQNENIMIPTKDLTREEWLELNEEMESEALMLLRGDGEESLAFHPAAVGRQDWQNTGAGELQWYTYWGNVMEDYP